jgi:hypothetical protein
MWQLSRHFPAATTLPRVCSVVWVAYVSGIQPEVRLPPGVRENILGGT